MSTHGNAASAEGKQGTHDGVMFETFNVPAFYVAIQAVLSLFATGNTTGLALDSGHGVTHTVPIFEGYALPHAILRTELAGCDLTAYLEKLLANRGVSVSSMDDLKEKTCFVSQNFQTEKVTERMYDLPDGTRVAVGGESFQCPELMFQPSLDQSLAELEGVQHTAFKSVSACDPEIQAALYRCVVLSGGNTMFSGMQDRVCTELQRLASTSSVKIEAPQERKYIAWVGGSILSSLDMFQYMWISKKEYEDAGPAIVHEKCF